MIKNRAKLQQFLEIKEAAALVAVVGVSLSYLRFKYLSYRDDRKPIVHTFDFREKAQRLVLIESDLLKVRRTCKRIPELKAEWQFWAMVLTAFEFENYLVNEVWASEGERLRKYRLKISPYKDLIKQIEQR